MKLTRPLLLLFNPIYWLVTFLRNLFYDLGLFKSTFFNLPTIVIGNLSTGGTGKTPHTEYLVRLLKDKKRLAVLSRGYGRKSVGFQLAKENSTTLEIGDEPAQIKQKFPEIIVAVDAYRVQGIQTLLAEEHPPEVVLLDDAFQHRKLQAGFYVLLTPFQHLFVDDWVLPAGNLREPRSGFSRANCIIVTKCPPTLSEREQQKIIKRINPKSHQQVFFSAIEYDAPIAKNKDFSLKKGFLLVTGIANATPLISHLQAEKATFTHLNFPDHYAFTEKDTNKMITAAKRAGVTQVATTEKDFQRIDISALEKARLTLAYLPIKIKLIANQAAFDEAITDFVLSYD